MDMFVPKFSTGSIVLTDDNQRGKIISIKGETTIDEGSKGYAKWQYLVDLGNETVKKLPERKIRDVPEVSPSIVNEMDLFLADSLLLTKHSLPEELRIENTIKELLQLDSLIGGEVDGQKQHEGSL